MVVDRWMLGVRERRIGGIVPERYASGVASNDFNSTIIAETHHGDRSAVVDHRIGKAVEAKLGIGLRGNDRHRTAGSYENAVGPICQNPPKADLSGAFDA